MLRDTSESGEPEDLIEPLNGKQSRILDNEFSELWAGSRPGI